MVLQKAIKRGAKIVGLFVLAPLMQGPIISEGIAAEEATPDSHRVKNSWSGFPIVFYTPETKTGGGIAAIRIFYERGSGKDARPSNFAPILVYTQQKQISATLQADLYWNQERNHFIGMITHIKWPNIFYGIGNNTLSGDKEDFTQRATGLDARYQKKFRSSLYAGLQFQFFHSKLIEIEKDGLLAQGNITGIDKGTSSGLGLAINWDNRDNTYNPASGSLFQLSNLFFLDAFGSDHKFDRYQLDLRHYIALTSSQVLAVQGYMNTLNGDPPFYMLSLFGGQSLARGYYEGRYRDKSMLTLQAEYRFPIWKRCRGVCFAGTGGVAESLSNFNLDEFKTFSGAGFRFALIPAEKVNLRVDLGFTKDGSQLYLSMGEAF